MHHILIVIHHKLQLTLKLQLVVERHLPKFYTFREKITDRVHKPFFITNRVTNLTLSVIITGSVEIIYFNSHIGETISTGVYYFHPGVLGLRTPGQNVPAC